MNKLITSCGVALALACSPQVFAESGKTNLVAGELKTKDGAKYQILVEQPSELLTTKHKHDYVKMGLRDKDGKTHVIYVKRGDTEKLAHAPDGVEAMWFSGECGGCSYETMGT